MKKTQKWKRNTLQTKAVRVAITKLQYIWNTGTNVQHPRKAGQFIRKYHKLLQNLFQWSNGFPKEVNIFARHVSSQNASRRQRVFTGNRKHAGAQIMKKNSDIRDIQMRWATFQPEQTDD